MPVTPARRCSRMGLASDATAARPLASVAVAVTIVPAMAPPPAGTCAHALRKPRSVPPPWVDPASPVRLNRNDNDLSIAGPGDERLSAASSSASTIFAEHREATAFLLHAASPISDLGVDLAAASDRPYCISIAWRVAPSAAPFMYVAPRCRNKFLRVCGCCICWDVSSLGTTTASAAGGGG